MKPIYSALAWALVVALIYRASWLAGAGTADVVRQAAQRAGGHATLFRARDKGDGAFAPLGAAAMRLHRGLKAAFDPSGILNPGRMYAEL